MARYTDGMMDSPRVRERFRGVGVDGARAIGQELSHAGLKRLGAADLDEWNRVRLVMARHSPSVCAGLWSGQLDPLALVAELDKLSDADLDGWARVSGGAMRAELAATAPVTVDPGALAQTLLAAEGRVAEAERERFQHDLEQGNKLADDEACWAIETLMKTVAGMEPGPREAALRSLASL